MGEAEFKKIAGLILEVREDAEVDRLADKRLER
jgi:hypothetical protein